jgi:prevent-host-death family protein
VHCTFSTPHRAGRGKKGTGSHWLTWLPQTTSSIANALPVPFLSAPVVEKVKCARRTPLAPFLTSAKLLILARQSCMIFDVNLMRSTPMINIAQDIDSLSNFKRRTSMLMRRMKTDGHPLVLTVNGKPELVVQDAAAYQKVLEAVERLEAIEGIREELSDLKAGRTQPMGQVHAKLRKRHGLPG